MNSKQSCANRRKERKAERGSVWLWVCTWRELSLTFLCQWLRRRAGSPPLSSCIVLSWLQTLPVQPCRGLESVYTHTLNHNTYNNLWQNRPWQSIPRVQHNAIETYKYLRVCFCVCVCTLVMFVQQSTLTVKPGRPFVNHTLLGIGVFNCGVIVSDEVRLQERKKRDKRERRNCEYVWVLYIKWGWVAVYSIHCILIFAMSTKETNMLDCFIQTGNEAIGVPCKLPITPNKMFLQKFISYFFVFLSCSWSFLITTQKSFYCSCEQLFRFFCA